MSQHHTHAERHANNQRQARKAEIPDHVVNADLEPQLGVIKSMIADPKKASTKTNPERRK
jgi:hypothetical protein